MSQPVLTDLKFHPLANCWPLMDDEDLDKLAGSIRANGQLFPIVLDSEHLILDGRNRYLACLRVGVPVMYDVWRGNDVLDRIKHANADRSQHSKSVIAASVALMGEVIEAQRKAAKERQGARNDIPELIPECSQPADARDKLGEQFGVSGKYVSDAIAIKEASPELFEQVHKGDKSLTAAIKELRGTVHERVLSFMSDHNWHTLDEIHAECGGTATGVSARIRDLRKPEYGSHTVELSGDKYRLLPPNAEPSAIDQADDEPQPDASNVSVSRGDEESRKIITDFTHRLDLVTDGGVYTMETIRQAFGECSTNTAIEFVRMCEVAPHVEVHRSYGKKGLSQYTFIRTECVKASSRIMQLAERIATDAIGSARIHSAAMKIIQLLGGK